MSAPAPEPPRSEGPTRPPTRRFHLGPRTVAILLALVVAVELWARAGTDPDYPLPDVFRPIVIALVSVFGLSAFVPWRRVRAGTRLLAIAIVLAVLLLEARSRFEDAAEDRIELTDDVLLRYRYRPGAEVLADRASGRRMPINRLGLWDREYAVPKPPGVYRIVVLTGSIANDGAVPFDQRFHEVLERRIRGALPDGRTIEVINASCEGWSTLQQVRFLERVAIEYEPDFVVVAYMLTSASIQNGAYRRVGNSFFAFRFLPLAESVRTGSMCAMFAPYHEGYSFDLVVRNSLERLALLRRQHGFGTLVAVLPVLEEFDDPICNRLYDRVARTAEETGHDAIRVVDAFRGERFEDFVKPGERMDLCHPNADGHARIAQALDEALRPVLAREAQNSE